MYQNPTHSRNQVRPISAKKLRERGRGVLDPRGALSSRSACGSAPKIPMHQPRAARPKSPRGDCISGREAVDFSHFNLAAARDALSSAAEDEVLLGLYRAALPHTSISPPHLPLPPPPPRLLRIRREERTSGLLARSLLLFPSFPSERERRPPLPRRGTGRCSPPPPPDEGVRAPPAPARARAFSLFLASPLPRVSPILTGGRPHPGAAAHPQGTTRYLFLSIYLLIPSPTFAILLGEGGG